MIRRKFRPGAIGGAVILYLALIGMIEAFEDRFIISNVIGLGTTLVLVTLIGTGYLASKPTEEHHDPPVLAGLAAGAFAGLFIAVCVVILEAMLSADIQVRNVFVSVTPGLLNVLEFGAGKIPGPILLVIVGAALGAAAGALRTLAVEWRGAIVYGLSMVLGVSLAEPLLVGVIDGLSIPSDWLYDASKGGLTVAGTIITLVAAGVGRWFWLRKRDTIVQFRAHMPDDRRRKYSRVAAGVIIAVLVALPWIVGTFISDVLGTVGLYVLLGLGLNIVVGYAGLLDLGYVAFFAVGAYATGVLTSTASFLVTNNRDQFAAHGFLNFWVALPVVVVIAVIIGAAIGAPVLRLRGDYLAIVTLGFGEIIRTLVLSDWLAPYLGGAQGLLRVPPAPPDSWNLRDPRNLYYLIMVFGLIGALVAYRLKDSRVGRAWAAMREDEDVAEAMGVSVVRYKLLAFAIGAGVGSLGGVFFAAKIGSIFPNSFSLLVSINVLSVIILGGIGSIPGVVIGAFVLVGLPEFLREFGEFRLLIYGAILVGIMILRPEGLIPNKRRLRELHVADQEAHMGELVTEEPA
jgi:branched-chain amino acid transport system permease protein